MEQTSSQTTDAGEAAPKPIGLMSRCIGIIFSPRQTFAAIVRQPKWLMVMLLLIVISSGLTFGFLSTEVGQRAFLDRQVQQTEAWGGQVSDQQYAAMERMLPVMKYVTVGGIIVAMPIMTLITAGILFGIFAALGGDATFKQALSVVTHAGVISVLGQIFITPLNYMRESMTSATNLAALLPMLPENGFPAKFLGMVDLFIVWYVMVLAIGLAVLYRRKTRNIALSLFGIYALIAVVVAVIQAMRSGS